MLMLIQSVVPQIFKKAIYHTSYANIERNLLELDSAFCIDRRLS